jgi:hypothetical protein
MKRLGRGGTHHHLVRFIESVRDEDRPTTNSRMYCYVSKRQFTAIGATWTREFLFVELCWLRGGSVGRWGDDDTATKAAAGQPITGSRTVPSKLKLGPPNHVRGHGRLHSAKTRLSTPHGARVDSDWLHNIPLSACGSLLGIVKWQVGFVKDRVQIGTSRNKPRHATSTLTFALG